MQTQNAHVIVIGRFYLLRKLRDMKLKAVTSQNYVDHFKWTLVVLLVVAIVGANAYFATTALASRQAFATSSISIW